jgi:ATP-dependent RNA helicase DDX18/HAS1
MSRSSRSSSSRWLGRTLCRWVSGWLGPVNAAACSVLHQSNRPSTESNRQPPTANRTQVYPYHEGVRESARQSALSAFLTALPPAGPPAPARAPQSDAADAPEPIVLVCTDRTSRGIDSIYCEHVVLFDFPRDPSEYVRRAGRTARGAGGRGVVSVLVLGKQVPLAREILDQNQKGRPVHSIPEAERKRW